MFFWIYDLPNWQGMPKHSGNVECRDAIAFLAGFGRSARFHGFTLFGVVLASQRTQGGRLLHIGKSNCFAVGMDKKCI